MYGQRGRCPAGSDPPPLGWLRGRYPFPWIVLVLLTGVYSYFMDRVNLRVPTATPVIVIGMVLVLLYYSSHQSYRVLVPFLPDARLVRTTTNYEHEQHLGLVVWCYNGRSNNQSHHPSYTPLEIVLQDDSMVLEPIRVNVANLAAKEDQSAKSLAETNCHAFTQIRKLGIIIHRRSSTNKGNLPLPT